MPDYAYFMANPVDNVVTAATPLEAAQVAATKYAQDEQGQQEGTATYPIWVVPVTAVKSGDCTVTITVKRDVTVTVTPRPA
jgi:hypothetical protein